MYAGFMRLVVLLAIAAIFVRADNRCATCHPRETAAYRETGMGRSLSVAVPANVAGQFEHRLSNTLFRIANAGETVVHSMKRDGREESHPIAWAVGSGNQGKSYLLRAGDALFQSPISWYSARGAWDLSPGFEQDRNPGFFRPVTAECLTCHSDSARPKAGTLNRYENPPFGELSIGCRRCHGDGSAHVAAGGAAPIVNPAKLDPLRRDAVCEQCHLSGEARIPNPGRSFSDFQPGERLEDSFSVYVRHSPGDPRGLKVVSHAEQLALSRCSTASQSKLWCGTCHDPHRSPADKVSWYREKCLSCHQDRKTALHRSAAGEDCAGCHMPQTGSYDGGHTAFHDHRIGKPGAQPGALASSYDLRAWRRPEKSLERRNLALAYISVAAKGEKTLLRKGFALLDPSVTDGAAETARGMVLLEQGRAADALKAFHRAANAQPRDSTVQLNLAAAYLASGDQRRAKQHAEESIALEPLLEDAYVLLSEIEPTRASYWRGRYTKLVPGRILP